MEIYLVIIITAWIASTLLIIDILNSGKKNFMELIELQNGIIHDLRSKLNKELVEKVFDEKD